MELRHQLNDFAQQMEAKLRKNDHKTEWRGLPVEALLRKLEIELEELKVAIQYEGATEARSECADVANFAMMLWDRLGDVAPAGQYVEVTRSPTDAADKKELLRRFLNEHTPVNPDIYRPHGSWMDGNVLVSNMYKKDGDNFTLFYDDVPRVRARGTLHVIPADAVILPVGVERV